MSTSRPAAGWRPHRWRTHRRPHRQGERAVVVGAGGVAPSAKGRRPVPNGRRRFSGVPDVGARLAGTEHAVAEQERRLGSAEPERHRDEAVDDPCDGMAADARRAEDAPAFSFAASRRDSAPRTCAHGDSGRPRRRPARDGNVKRVRGFTIPEALPRASSRPRCRASAIPRGRG